MFIIWLSIASLVLSLIICLALLDANFFLKSLIFIFKAIVCVLIASWVHAVINFIINPLTELNKKLGLLSQYEIELALPAEYKNCSSDIRALYDSFSNLSLTFNFANNALTQKDNETLSLLSYADSYQMFKGKNEKATGICMNNIGNIHYRAKRYNEAANAYKEAIKIAENLIEE